MSESTSYIVCDGLREIYLSGKTSLHACHNFIRRLKKTGEFPGPIFYVRRSKGGSYENHEVWYFSFQFKADSTFVFSSTLQDQHAEPEFINKRSEHRKDLDTVKPRNAQERKRHKNRKKGLCEICGKEKKPKELRCPVCREKRNKLNRRHYHVRKERKKNKEQLDKIDKLDKELSTVQTEIDDLTEKEQCDTSKNRKEAQSLQEEFHPPRGAATKYKPGSDAKVAILIARRNQGEDFWHPDDEKLLITREEYLDKIHNDEELSEMEKVEIESQPPNHRNHRSN